MQDKIFSKDKIAIYCKYILHSDTKRSACNRNSFIMASRHVVLSSLLILGWVAAVDQYKRTGNATGLRIWTADAFQITWSLTDILQTHTCAGLLTSDVMLKDLERLKTSPNQCFNHEKNSVNNVTTLNLPQES